LSWIEKQSENDKANCDLIIQFQIANNDRMDQMHKSLDMLNQGQTPHIDASNSMNSPLVMTPYSSTRPAREISLGFPHFDGTSLVLE